MQNFHTAERDEDGKAMAIPWVLQAQFIYCLQGLVPSLMVSWTSLYSIWTTSSSSLAWACALDRMLGACFHALLPLWCKCGDSGTSL